MKMGELLNGLPKATTNHKQANLENDTPVDFLNSESAPKPKSEVIAEIGLSQKQAERIN